MIKVFQDIPCCFLNFIAGKNHVDACIDRVLYFNGQNTGVAVQILCFSFKSVKPVCILQIQFCDASHSYSPFLCFEISLWEVEKIIDGNSLLY